MQLPMVGRQAWCHILSEKMFRLVHTYSCSILARTKTSNFLGQSSIYWMVEFISNRVVEFSLVESKFIGNRPRMVQIRHQNLMIRCLIQNLNFKKKSSIRKSVSDTKSNPKKSEWLIGQSGIQTLDIIQRMQFSCLNHAA